MHTWNDEKIVFEEEQFLKFTKMFSRVVAILSAFLLVRHIDNIRIIDEEKFSILYETLCNNQFTDLAKVLYSKYNKKESVEITA